MTGLDYILTDIYDLILLDVMLPKINGFDVLKNARNEELAIAKAICDRHDAKISVESIYSERTKFKVSF